MVTPDAPRRSFAIVVAGILAVAGLASSGIDHLCSPTRPSHTRQNWDPDAALTDALLDLQAAAGLCDPRVPYRGS